MNKDNRRISILLAHPNINESRANKELIEAVKDLNFVTVYNIYEDFQEMFNPEPWSQIMHESAALVFQFPLYWMAAPYKLKKWQEEVFTHLSQTPMVIGKPLMVVTTLGADEDSYRSGGKNHFTVDEILRPYQASAINAGMSWETPLVVYEIGSENTGRNLTQTAIQYKEKLQQLKGIDIVKISQDW